MGGSAPVYTWKPRQDRWNDRANSAKPVNLNGRAMVGGDGVGGSALVDEGLLLGSNLLGLTMTSRTESDRGDRFIISIKRVVQPLV